jgi:hypothetical protein
VKDISGNVSDALDAALEMTFPASDPIAVFIDDYDAWDGATTHVGGAAQTSIALDGRGAPAVPS